MYCWQNWGPILYSSRMWHISMWHALFTIKSFAILRSKSWFYTNIAYWYVTDNWIGSQLSRESSRVPRSCVHVRLDSILYINQSTPYKLSNSAWTALRRRVGRLWVRIRLYRITLLRVHWNRGQFPRKTCHIRMCHIHILYRIAPQMCVSASLKLIKWCEWVKLAR